MSRGVLLWFMALCAGCSRDALPFGGVEARPTDLGALLDGGETLDPSCSDRAGLAPDAPWPSQGGYAAQLHRSCFRGPRTLRPAWTFQADSIWTTPVIAADGTVYFVGRWELFAVEGTTGALRWRFSPGESLATSPALGRDDALFLLTLEGTLIALDARTGARRWTYKLSDRAASVPAVTSDGAVLVEDLGGTLHAIDGRTGLRRWAIPVPSGGMDSAAIGKDDTVYLGGWERSEAYALEASTGRVLWRVDTGVQTLFTPALGSDGALIVPSAFGVQSVDAGTGFPLFFVEFPPNGALTTSAAVGPDGTVYAFGYDRTLRAIAPATRRERWRFTCGEGVWSRRVSAPTVGSDGVVYLGTVDQSIYALAPEDGTALWSYRTGGRIGGSAAIGANGFVYIGSEDGLLYAFAP